MRITIEINCDNDVFQDGPEISRILKELGENCKDGVVVNELFIRDINGNVVGSMIAHED